MHASVMAWVAGVVAAYDLAQRRTLECGSRDVNGSVRPLFGGEYLGIDAQPGPGVDIVCSAHELPFADASFEVVVATEMLEHDPAFWRSLPEMVRVLAPGGFLILTARGIGFPRHDHPADYWRFTEDALALLIAQGELEPLQISADPEQSGVFALAQRARGAGPAPRPPTSARPEPRS
jgi:SAM-dependent methyltransferase